MMVLILLLCFNGIWSEEVSTPASYLGPKNFNYHPYEARQFLEEKIRPTKQGPVIFPNIGAPSTIRPLVVTTRPLVQAILDSDYTNQNNTVAESSINSVTYKPYLTRVQQYRPFVPSVPYADMLKKAEERGFLRANGYTDYEQATALPPIYKAFADYASQKVLNLPQRSQNHNHQPRSQDYYEQYNDLSAENKNADYDQNKNYAFSYTVKDHKTGDDFSHSQQSTGSATNGEYRVRLPDGRIQTVSYTADENGYKADVRYNDDHSSNRIDDYNDKYDNNDNINYKYNPINNDKINNKNDYTRHEIPIREPTQYESNDYYDYTDYAKTSKTNTLFNPSSTSYLTINSDKIQDSLINKYLHNPSSTVSYVTTLKPTYEEIKDSINGVHNPVNYINENAVEINEPYNNDAVLIGSNRYTDVSTISAVTPFNIVTSTPSSIVSYKNSKPILSESFINRINKYLTFN